MSVQQHRKSFISLFARHKVAANLLMAMMLLSGFVALSRINIQFLPTFRVETITVGVVWNGASAEDVENAITNPLENELRNINQLKTLSSISRTNGATVTLEFEQGSDMGRAIEEVREQVSQIRNLPSDVVEPVIKRIDPYEDVAKLVITGPDDLDELRAMAHRFERELLDAGIGKVDIIGLPEQELAVQIPIRTLVELKLSLAQISDRIASRSVDFPAGTIGKAEVGRQLRSLAQQRSIQGFESLPIITDRSGQLIRLGDIAKIELRPQDNEVKAFYDGKPAIMMRLSRTENFNALTSARIFHNWLKQARREVGRTVQLHFYDETWIYIQERINLLLKNGAGGLVLIILILFLLLNRHVAFWVVVGIPTSFMAAIAALYIYGGSINMVSLFAIIMTLGIIVDDTIVIGEQTLTNFHARMHPSDAVESATHKMLAPIFSSSLTTICAFIPLLIISGIMGSILFAIPLVVICVILASLLECFLVLPGHLIHSFRRGKPKPAGKYKRLINFKFHRFKARKFRRLVVWSLNNRLLTLSIALASFIIAVGLIASGWINFTFFPSPESRNLQVTSEFTVGTPEDKITDFLKELNTTLAETNKSLSSGKRPILKTAVSFLNYTRLANRQTKEGNQFASMEIELISPDKRKITNTEFINAWRQRITLPPGLENFSIYAPRGGPPGEDIDIQMSGNSASVLKQAASELKLTLEGIKGVSDVTDDLPFGQDQLIYKLSPTGEALGLTVNQIGRQLRAAFNGEIAQIFHLPNEEIEVRVVLPERERNSLSTLEQFPIVTSAGQTVPLGTVVKLRYRRGPDVLLHTDTKLSIHVKAKVDSQMNNANKILAQMSKEALPKIATQYNLRYTLKGKAEEQQETFSDMKLGLMIGLVLIYIVLAWVFSSYLWPIVVMLVIPLGLTGAIVGHLVMHLDLTILSLFGLFGLSGIVINDSIILLSEFRLLRDEGWDTTDAIIEASTRRFRAVFLTSVTTIAGLTPLLFETSLQAQFLIPMATSIVFGLAFATLLILIIVPVLLSLAENLKSLRS